ncbi:RAI1-domain-containing protein [Testicularia cyperi]|uniref:Decapping nuclease n=1 Tax=Testicularia cyperi TaxID=1882483 RepID=A0A317XF64_9BASI|nr:RAI1-domain-containing protein [Testicularia cyperi]
MPDKRPAADVGVPAPSHKRRMSSPSDTAASVVAARGGKETDQPNSSSSSSSNPGILASLQHPLRKTGGEGVTSQSPFTHPPAFQQPQPLCSFSFDRDRKQWHDDRSKKYYRGPPPYMHAHPKLDRARPVFGADLNYGLDRYRQRDESVPEHLDALVASLQHRTESAKSVSERQDVDRERRRADVVTWRGMVTKICTAYDQDPNARIQDPFHLNAMLVDGTLYLEEHTSESSRREKTAKEADPQMKRFGYYGYSFESYCTVDEPDQISLPFDHPATLGSPGAPPGWSGDVDTNVQWCQVVKTKLGCNRLVIGGEVDAAAFRPHSSSPAEHLVELKTSMSITPYTRNAARSISDQERFEKKLLKFFLQSYLLGISSIVVGFRDHHGLLTMHQEFETLKIPRMVRAGLPIPGQFDSRNQPVIRQTSVWEPKDSLGFADQILSFVRHAVSRHTLSVLSASQAKTKPSDPVNDNPDTDCTPTLPLADEAVQRYPVYRISFQHPFERLEIRSLTDSEIHHDVKNSGTSGERVGFLPRRFYEFVHLQASASAPA